MSTGETDNGKLCRKLFLDIQAEKRRQKLALGQIAGNSQNNKSGWIHLSIESDNSRIYEIKNLRPILPTWDI